VDHIFVSYYRNGIKSAPAFARTTGADLIDGYSDEEMETFRFFLTREDAELDAKSRYVAPPSRSNWGAPEPTEYHVKRGREILESGIESRAEAERAAAFYTGARVVEGPPRD
jgi:hypothetical protein